MSKELTPQEQQRIADCVNACYCLGNPASLPDVLQAITALVRAWVAEERVIGLGDAEAQALMDALELLDLRPPPQN